MISTCAQTKTRSSTSVVVSSAKSPESASETGDQPAGQAFRPSAICVACQRSRVVTIPAMRARMRSASPRWLPSNRAGRCTLRIAERRHHADEHEDGEQVDEEREPALALEPAERRARGKRRLAVDDGRDRHEDRREEDDEAPEDERVHEPGNEALEELPLPEDDGGFVPHAHREVGRALDRRARAHEPREEQRAAREEPAGDRGRDGERDRGGDARGRLSASRLPQLGRDRRHDLVQVADHRVVGAREDRRLRVGVDREDRLRALAAGHVLRRARDAAGDVDVGRDLRPRLPDLVGVRPPAGHRHGARAADRAAEQPRELLDDPEALRRAGAAAARDDDLRLGERDAAGRRARRARVRARRGRRRRGRGVKRSTAAASPAPAPAATACGWTVRSFGAP